MNTKRMGLVAGVLSAIVLSAPPAQAQGSSLILTDLRGALRVSQRVPCDGVVEATTTIAAGRMHISPTLVRGAATGADTLFDLSRLEVFFTPFAVQAECLGVKANVEFREIGVRLAGAIQFTGYALGDGQYRFVIPRQDFLLYESVVTNLPVPQPMTDYKWPSEDVSGEIDIRHGTVQLHVVLSSRLRFVLGCRDNGKRCLIDEVGEGTQTADVTGSIHPPATDPDRDGVADTVPPALSCTPAGHSRQHRIAAADDFGGRLSLTLGSFSLDNGEVIQIEETGKPGVRLLGTVGHDGVRHFQVGKGDAFVVATDAAGNVARAACGVPDTTSRR